MGDSGQVVASFNPLLQAAAVDYINGWFMWLHELLTRRVLTGLEGMLKDLSRKIVRSID